MITENNKFSFVNMLGDKTVVLNEELKSQAEARVNKEKPSTVRLMERHIN